MSNARNAVTISVLIVRYTSARFPSKSDDMGA